MTKQEQVTITGGIFRWIDTPWVVAAMLGIWGVMIGIEAFLAADIFASAAAILVGVALAKETLIWTRRRRTIPFVVGLLLVLATMGSDFWWTGHQKTTSETKNAQLAKLDQIPQLQQTIQSMTKKEQEASQAQAVEQGKLEQKVSDIGDDNKRLKTSIEKKDAALAKIAQEQYALNFTPQVVIETRDTADQLFLQNNGKTNIEMQLPHCDNLNPLVRLNPEQPSLVAPNSYIGYILNDSGKQTVLAYVLTHPDGRIPFSCQVDVVTLDKKHYSIAFTLTFIVKDNAITKSFGVTNQMVEVQ